MSQALSAWDLSIAMYPAFKLAMMCLLWKAHDSQRSEVPLDATQSAAGRPWVDC